MFSEFQNASTATIVGVCIAAFIVGCILLFIFAFGIYLVLRDHFGLFKGKMAECSVATDKGVKVTPESVEARIDNIKAKLKAQNELIDTAKKQLNEASVRLAEISEKRKGHNNG